MKADVIPAGGGERSNSSRLNEAQTNDSSADAIRRLQNRPNDSATSPALLDRDAGEKPEAALRRRAANGANRISPARSSSAIPTIQD